MNSKKKFMFKEYNSTHGVIMVITDIEIIGKKFEDEKLQLDFSKKFYQGEEKTEQEIIERTQIKMDGNRRKAAKALNISERTLYRKIKEYGLEK